MIAQAISEALQRAASTDVTLNTRRWKTRVELAEAVHDYIEIFHNKTRRHSALGMLTPTEYENQQHQQAA